MVLNQTISTFFLILIACLLNNVMILQGEIIYWSLLGVKEIFTVIYPVDLSAQVVEHCTGIAEVMPYFHYCSSTVYYC